MFQAHSSELSARKIREIEAKVDAAWRPERIIRITVSGLLAVGDFRSVAAGYISFTVQLGSEVGDTLAEIYRRLPSTEHDIRITTVGPQTVKELHEYADAEIYHILETWDADEVRLSVSVPKMVAEGAEKAERAPRKKGIRNVFNNAFGSNGRSDIIGETASTTQTTAPSCVSGRSVPPSYDEAVKGSD